MVINRSKFKTKIGIMYYLWEDSGNGINVIFMGNNRKSYLDYLEKLKDKNKSLGQLTFNEKKSGRIEAAIGNYLDGNVRKINLKPKFITGTEFEKKVLSRLISIPYGKTISYKKLAVLIGHPDACRAIGSALRKNPVMLAVPCHRVIRSDGSIGKFSGGGENVKKFLLALEQSVEKEGI